MKNTISWEQGLGGKGSVFLLFYDLISSSNLNIFAPQTRYNMELNEHNKAEYPPMHTDKPDTP